MAKYDMDDRAAMDGDHDDDQSFSPAARTERAKVSVGRRPGKLVSLERLREFAKNRYEGVLIASARARQLNAKKIAMEERGMEEALDLKRLKMTTFAMSELVEGKLKVERPADSTENAQS